MLCIYDLKKNLKRQINEEVVAIVDNEYIDKQRRLSTLPCYLSGTINITSENYHQKCSLEKMIFFLLTFSKG